MPVLRGPLKDDRIFPKKDMLKILSLTPLKNRVLVRLVFDMTSKLIYVPKNMERTTMSIIVQTPKDEEFFKKYDRVLHNNRAGFQFSFSGDDSFEKYRIIPTKLIQAVIK